jgi:hypothetical protein
MNEEWINRVIQEFKETIIFETKYEEGMRCHYQDAVNWLRAILEKNQERNHQELQKAREEERERIETIFKEHVPPHAMDLEDSVWLKRLLNKAFNHDKNI